MQTRLKALLICLFAYSCLATGTATAAIALDKVTIDGLQDAALRKNARGYLSANDYLGKDNLSELFVRQIYLRGQREIAEALQPFGYYQSKVTGHIEQNGDRWSLLYNVDKGKQSYWRRITVQINGDGVGDTLLNEVLSKNSLWPGQPVSHQAYETLKTGLEKTALNNGFLNARWKSSALKVGPPQPSGDRAVDVELVLDSGRQFYFGKVIFDGAKLSNKLLDRYVPFTENTPFNSAGMRRLQYQLNDSDYFSSVSLLAPPKSAQRNSEARPILPVTAKVTMRKRHLYSLGAGYGTDTGARGNLGWQARWLNSAGHKFNSKLEGSQVGADAQLRYSIPIRNPVSDSLSFTLNHKSEEQPEGETLLTRSGINLSRQHRGWQWRVYSQYLHEKFTLSANTEVSDLLIFGVAADKRNSKKVGASAEGYRFSWDVHGAHDALLSDTSFLQANLAYRRLDPLDESWRIISRSQVGANFVTKFSEIPLSERYFTGGDQTVRGYKYKTLASRDSDGDLIGGQYLATASIELEYLIGESWGLAIFADAGNAFDSLDEGFHYGTGLGVRFRLPVGSLRIDIGLPTDNPSDARIHLSLGPDL